MFYENQGTIDIKDQYDIELEGTPDEKVGMAILTSLLIEKLDRFWKVDKEDDFEGIDEPWDHYVSTPLWKLCEWVDKNAIEDWMERNFVYETLYENYCETRREDWEKSFLEENPDGDLCGEDFYAYMDECMDEVNYVWWNSWIDEFFSMAIEELGLTFEWRGRKDSIRKTFSFSKGDLSEGDLYWRESINSTWDDYLIETNLVGFRNRRLEELGL